jgi:hypothetical protein
LDSGCDIRRGRHERDPGRKREEEGGRGRIRRKREGEGGDDDETPNDTGIMIILLM